MAALSIIIPVFNKESYLAETITSILKQEFTDFELLVIDDGSTDNSLEIIKQFKDSRIKVFEQENQGVSAARNLGITQSNGDFIGFIDADDVIDSDMYSTLVSNALEYECDISACRIKVVHPNKVDAPFCDDSVAIYGQTEALKQFFKGNLDRSANNKIYRREILSDVRFEGQIYEDILFSCRAFLNSEKTVMQNSLKYHYIVRDNSVSMSIFNPKYHQTIDVSSKMLELVKNGQLDSSVLDEAKAFDVLANVSLLNLILLSDKHKHRDIYSRVKSRLSDYSHFISSNPAVRKKHRYAYKIFSFSPALYSTAMNIYCHLTGAEAIKRT